MGKMRVIGLGQCSLDRLAVVDHYPAADEKIDVLESDEQGGGPVATALVTLSRLAGPEANVIKTSFWGVVGSDPEGQQILKSMTDESVDVRHVKIRNPGISQVSFIAVEKGTGHRTIFCRRPPLGSELKPSEIDSRDLAQADFLLLDGVMEEASLFAAKEAKRHGVPVMLDAGRIRSRTMELASLCDFVVGSSVFAHQLGWDGSPEHLQPKIASLGPRTVTLTFGSRGSITFADGSFFRTPAFPVQTVDTTGAGDVFHGAYLFGLLKNWNLPEVARFASACAALKCRHLGGRRGIPTLEEALTFSASAQRERR